VASSASLREKRKANGVNDTIVHFVRNLFINFTNSFTSKMNDKFVVKQYMLPCDLSLIIIYFQIVASFLTFIFHKVTC